MSTIPRVTDTQRRALLARRHLLGPEHRAASVRGVAEAVLALHATDPATVHLSVAARLHDARHEDVEPALCEPGSLLRMTAMRCTLFVVPTALAPVMLAAAGRPQAAARTKDLLRRLEQTGLGDAAWLEKVGEAALEALRERGEASTAELAAAVPGLERQIVVSPGKPYESRRSIASEVLFVLAAEGRIVRGSRRGGWTSNQYAWAPAPAPAALPARQARAGLARHWLGAFGPGTLADLKWWTGWTLTDTRTALADAGAVEVALDERDAPGFVRAEDLDALAAGDADEHEPSAVLLPALDPTPMG
ncbi:hypothetical protein GCM10023237_66340 [Streptomyces coeruleoprunus]